MRSAAVLVVLVALAALAAVPTGIVQAQVGDHVVTSEGVTRVAFLADAQHEGAREGLRQMVAHLEQANASLLLYGGDTSYGWGDAPQDWLDALGPYAEPERMLFVYGNHDGGAGYRTYQPDGLPDVTWWSARVGDVVVVGLDTNDDLAKDSPQMRWLADVLAENETEFVLVMMHKPWWVPNVYHRGSAAFSGDTARLAELVAEHDADLVLAGHQHYYARHEFAAAPHVIVGPADARTREVPAEVARAALFSAQAETGLVLDLSSCGARVWTLDQEGVVLDAFEAPAFEGPLGSATTLDDGRVCFAGDAYPYVPRSAPEARQESAMANDSAEQGTEATAGALTGADVEDEGDAGSELPGWLAESLSVYSALVATAVLVLVLRRGR